MKKTFVLISVLFATVVISCGNNNIFKEADAVCDPTLTENAGQSIKNLTKKEFLDKVMDYEKNPDAWNYKGTKPCLIDFYADWCRPCKLTAPILEELAAEYQGKIDIYKINIDQERELAQVFGVQSIPAFLVCPMEGKPRMSSGIGPSAEETKKMFKQLIEDYLLI